MLIYMALHSNDQGKNIRPGIKNIADQTRYGPRTVIKWLAWLVAHEYLLLDGKYGYVDQYRLNLSKFGMDAANYQKPKLRKPPTLEPIPPQEPMPQLPDLLITAKMRTLKRRIESYISLKVVNPKEAELWRPSSDEMKTLIDLYEHLCEISHPDAQQWEHAARYARQELSAVF